MPLVKHAEAFESVRARPVFTVADLRKLGVPGDYAKARLHQLAMQGRIRSVERGRYSACQDHYAVAANLTHPSYLGLWSALELHGLTDQNPGGIDVMTSRRRHNSSIDFDGVRISFHLIAPAHMYGFESMLHEGHRIPVAKPEKVVIDAILTGLVPMDELGDALDASDRRLLKEYAVLSGAKAVRTLRVMGMI